MLDKKNYKIFLDYLSQVQVNQVALCSLSYRKKIFLLKVLNALMNLSAVVDFGDLYCIFAF